MITQHSKGNLTVVSLGTMNDPTLSTQFEFPSDGMFSDDEQKNAQRIRYRSLYSADYSSLLVDKDGNEYEPYSLAWRYLGMYIDCDSNNDDDNNGAYCQRVVLWAAYVDPRYAGGTIGEYQFYDLSKKRWDRSTCKAPFRCAKTDCHEPNTHFKLVGVFKEPYGIEDWAEQLFKHEGYCIWDDDTYETMQTYREEWATECQFYGNAMGQSGNYYNFYVSMKPLSEGKFTYGLYEDNTCSLESNYTVSDFIRASHGYSAAGKAAAGNYTAMWDKVNEYMNVYKICQPCRAYNLNMNAYSTDDQYNQNDGEGDEEQWGYNCYDDAGYTNCNQCYKFESKTYREAADIEDLIKASEQGTILRIKVNGRTYGKGGFHSHGSTFSNIVYVVMSSFAFALVVIVFLVKPKDRNKRLPESLKERLSSSWYSVFDENSSHVHPENDTSQKDHHVQCDSDNSVITEEEQDDKLELKRSRSAKRLFCNCFRKRSGSPSMRRKLQRQWSNHSRSVAKSEPGTAMYGSDSIDTNSSDNSTVATLS